MLALTFYFRVIYENRKGKNDDLVAADAKLWQDGGRLKAIF